MSARVVVHRFQANLFPVNAYIVETPTSVIVVDATLGVSDARALRARADALHKPLAGVVVTHSHPDHYGGVAPFLGADALPVCAVDGVNAVIRRDDAVKEQILRPMFGAEWPLTRTFPNRTVDTRQPWTLADATFTVVDAGPCESPHDSWWLIDSADGPCAFVGDLVYSHMHAYLADGFYEQWLASLERAKRVLPKDARILMGHGEPGQGHALLDWQAEYIHRFIDVVRAASGRGLDGDTLADAVMASMQQYLPTEDLLFLARLSVGSVRDRLAGGSPAGGHVTAGN